MTVTKSVKNGSEVLVIEIPITRQQSKSGKSIVVATTNGNQTTNIQVDGKNVVIGLNAYIPVK